MAVTKYPGISYLQILIINVMLYAMNDFIKKNEHKKFSLLFQENYCNSITLKNMSLRIHKEHTNCWSIMEVETGITGMFYKC
jgi:hypothetical protein